MDLYFARHDGQAVTCDDFVAAMADANGADLAQFKRWYDQAGTPTLAARGEYDAAAQRYTLTVEQSVPPTPGQPSKLPMHIPLAVGLVGPDGREHPAAARGRGRSRPAPIACCRLRAPEERFVFVDVAQRPVPSLLRGFSAPVNLKFDYAEADLVHLMAHDSDAFNRWEAGQRLALAIILRGVEAIRAGRPVAVPQAFLDAVGRVLGAGPARSGLRRRSARAAVGNLRRRADGRGRSRRHPRRTERAAPRDRAAPCGRRSSRRTARSRCGAPTARMRRPRGGAPCATWRSGS